MAKITVPELSVPFPVATSPYGDEVDARSVEWAEEYGLFPREEQFARIKEARLGRLAARIYPLAALEVLQVIADWQVWLFALDDGYCDEADFGARPAEMAQMAARLLRVVDRPDEEMPAGAGWCAPALADVRGRLAGHATPAQLERWTACVHDYLFGVVWEAANRARGTVPGLSDYVPMRRLAGAIPTCLGLIDVSTAVEVPAGEWRRPELRRLADMAANLIGWDNDVVSYNKETADHGAMHNLVTVLAHEHGCTRKAAVDIAVAMHEAEVAKFVRLEAEMVPGLSGAGRAYVEGLKHWVSGFLDYARDSSRYR